MTLNKTAILNSFLYSALWTEELDADYDIDDFVPSALTRAGGIIDIFLERAPKKALIAYLVYHSGDPEGQLGHDIWLSICGHGAGFFDHPLLGLEDQLQDVCRKMSQEGDKPGCINEIWVNKENKILIE